MAKKELDIEAIRNRLFSDVDTYLKVFGVSMADFEKYIQSSKNEIAKYEKKATICAKVLNEAFCELVNATESSHKTEDYVKKIEEVALSGSFKQIKEELVTAEENYKKLTNKIQNDYLEIAKAEKAVGISSYEPKIAAYLPRITNGEDMDLLDYVKDMRTAYQVRNRTSVNIRNYFKNLHCEKGVEIVSENLERKM